jgi:hypothetical protein
METIAEKELPVLSLLSFLKEKQKLVSLMMEAARTSETSVDNHFTRQYNPEDSSEHHSVCLFVPTVNFWTSW